MILRNSFSKAKKLFHNTLQTFKTMLSNGYERLPKTPPLNPFSCSTNSKLHSSFRDLNSLCEDGFGDDPDERTMKSKTPEMIKIPWNENKDDSPYNGSFMKFAQRRKQDPGSRKAEKSRGESSPSFRSRAEACCAVTRRLKELQLLDISNVDHLLDIEEVLHYYSRITCPFYVDIVNKFFMEMCAEFLPQTSPAGSISRRIPNW